MLGTPRAARAADQAPDPAAAADAARIDVYICDAESMSITPWRRTLVYAIGRAVTNPLGTRARVMGEARCGADAVEFACTAGVFDRGGRVLTCSPDTLLRLVRVSAWYALRHDEQPDEDYEAFRERQPAPLGLKAFAASSPTAGDQAFDARIERLRTEVEANERNWPEGRSTRIFQATLHLVFSAVFGHEASHLEDAPPFCAFVTRSRIEDGGLWSVLLRVSSSGELYKPATPVAGEVAADRCAARRIRAEREVLEASPLPPEDQAFVRRAAADITSTMLLGHIDGPGGRLVFLPNDAYLYPPLRILALAGEMNAGERGPMVCGGAAENLVQAAQLTFRAQPGGGMMPDEMEHAFPKGVIDAWERRGDWSPAAYACR